MVRDPLSLLLAFISNNWKLILVSTIGLTLALATVAETNYIASFYRESLFEDFANAYGGGADFSISVQADYADSETFKSEFSELVNNFQGLGRRTADKLDYQNFIEREGWHFHLDTYSYNNQTQSAYDNWDNAKLELVDEDTLQILQNFLTVGEMPQSSNETILIINSDDMNEYNFQLGEEVLLTSSPPYRPSSLNATVNATAIISGIIEFDYNYRYHPYEPEQTQTINKNETLLDYFGWYYYWPRMVFVTTQNNFVDITAILYYNQSITLDVYGEIHLFLDNLDSFSLQEETARLQNFEQELDLEIYDLGFYGDHDKPVSANIVYMISYFEITFTMTIFFIWLFSLPTVVTTLFLANYSLSLLRKRKQQQIGIMKTRGASSRQIMKILFGEAILGLIISVFLGCGLGLPFSILAMQTSVSILFPVSSSTIYLMMGVFQWTLIFGILFVILLSLRSIRQLANMEIKESIIPQEIKKPIWKKYYLDIILLIAGFIGISLIFALQHITSIFPDLYEHQEIMIIYNILMFMTFFLGLPSPILVATGGAMFIARILPFFIRKSARWTWKYEGGIISFSFRNILNRLAHASRAALLISVALAFMIAFIMIPHNADRNVMDSLYYHNTGGDIIVSVYPDINETLTLNHTLLNYFQNNLTGISSVSPIAEASELSTSNFQILGIDVNTFAQTAFFRPDFLNPDALSSLMRLDLFSTAEAALNGDLLPDSPDLNTLLSRLESNTTFLMQEDTLKAQRVNVGSIYPVIFQQYNETSDQYYFTYHNLTIVGTFKCWPLFITYPIDQPSSYYGSYYSNYMIGNLSTILEYANKSYIRIDKFSYLIDVIPGYSMKNIKTQIYNDTGLEILTIDELTESYLSDPGRGIMYSTIDSSLLMMVIVSIFTILMFSFSSLMERTKEIGVERALGMSLTQTSILFIIEAAIIILFGIIVGTILGMLVGQVFLSLTRTAQLYFYPPTIITYPIDIFGGIAITLFSLGIIGSVIPAFLATRTKIGNILRAN